MATLTSGFDFKRNAPDIGLAVLVLMIVGMMIVPLPTPLLDILLAANIALAVLLLLVAMYASTGLELASFPTLLLVTTLFRLALNISSTRLILLQADAGEVIRAFGDFVVRGNYVVGGVIFFLLTLVQFLVIAKGAERVAEVGARFTLDAMPGKQMSIDAELRSGGLDQETARKKRTHLARESQFYGAMDGAMKFVKGDAIAGIIITIVNLVGGLIVGVAMHDMDAGTSMRTYGLLTIGDGLVSQIPALLLSTAAGLVVTRVASEEEGGSLGRDVVGQIFGKPRPLLVAGGFLLVLGIVPGLPALPFFVLGGSLLLLARRLLRTPAPTLEASAMPAKTGVGEKNPHVPLVSPLSIELGTGLRARIGDGPTLAEALAAFRERFFVETGISLPQVRVRESAWLEADAFVIAVKEVPAARETSTVGTAAELEAALVGALDRVVRRHAGEFVGLQETQSMLDQLERAYPALVRNVVPKPMPLSLLADVLRRIADEGVSIRPLREILETLALHAPTEKDPIELTELCRGSLRRHITHQHAPTGALSVHLVSPSLEDAVRDSVRRTASGSYLAMPPDLARDAVDAAKRAADDLGGGQLRLLTQPDVRRFVFRLLEHELPGLVVLSYAELAPGVIVHPLGRVEP